jgi:chromosome segregation ATPase
VASAWLRLQVLGQLSAGLETRQGGTQHFQTVLGQAHEELQVAKQELSSMRQKLKAAEDRARKGEKAQEELRDAKQQLREVRLGVHPVLPLSWLKGGKRKA